MNRKRRASGSEIRAWGKRGDEPRLEVGEIRRRWWGRNALRFSALRLLEIAPVRIVRASQVPYMLIEFV
jgi:hypothetical protein